MRYDNQIAAAVSGARPSRSGWVRANCPICPFRLGKPDRKRSLGLLLGVGAYNCFRCGVSGKIDPDLVGGEVPERIDVQAAAMQPPESFSFLASEPGVSASVFDEARSYLLGRGIGPDLWHGAALGACFSGRYGGRVIAPILAQNGGSWLGWVARLWFDGADVPYLYPPGMRRVLYNHEALLRETEEPAILVEGVFDALAVWPNGVAFLGKPSEEQVSALMLARRPIAIVLDGDAHEEGWALATRLRFAGARAGCVRLPPLVDPDEVDREWLEEQARESITHEGGIT